MGELRNPIADPNFRLELCAISDQELFDTARRVWLGAGQADHYRRGDRPTTAREFITWLAVVCLGAGFVLFFWGLLPKIFSR